MDPVLELLSDWDLLEAMDEGDTDLLGYPTAEVSAGTLPESTTQEISPPQWSEAVLMEVPVNPGPGDRRSPPVKEESRPSTSQGRESEDLDQWPGCPIYLPVDRYNLCWRCGYPGHFRSHCTGPARLFCSRCGLHGVMSRDCVCRFDNYDSTRPSRTHYHHLQNRTSRGVQCAPYRPWIGINVGTQWEGPE